MKAKNNYEEPITEMWEMDICNVVSASTDEEIESGDDAVTDDP